MEQEKLSEQTIEDMKFIWAYMLTHGILTNGEWNQYSGDWESIRNKPTFVVGDVDFFEEFRRHGVNWEKTEVPEFDQHGHFMDTNSPSDQINTMIGTIVLGNDTPYKVGVRQAADEYQIAIDKLNAKENRVDLVKQVFG